MIDWNQHLLRASRPLALSVLSLDQPLRRSVTLGLVALQALQDVESESSWTPVERRRAILLYAGVAAEPSQRTAEALIDAIGSGPGFAGGLPELVQLLPELVRCVDRLPNAHRDAIWRHAGRAAERRIAFVMRLRSDGQVVLRDMEELAGYCHVHRGINAELITDLLVVAEPRLAAVAPELKAIAASSAQGIGLVDYLDDVGAGGSCPICVSEPLARGHVLEMTRAGMQRAERYVQVLRDAGAPRDVIAFASLPLAWAKSRLHRVCCTEPEWTEPEGGRRPSRPPPPVLVRRHSGFGVS